MNLYRPICKFLDKEQGITSIEYGLIAVAVAVFVVSVLYGDNSFILVLQEKFQILTFTVKNALVSKQ
ncbi:Flp family type IVb pilin [Pasteurella sp. PK-2025]|uniref:Flp family type IVb pilin n=1 Tax=Pasteurella sp. PK-2025 TaxID=3413133 RepID=UPI003C72C0A8